MVPICTLTEDILVAGEQKRIPDITFAILLRELSGQVSAIWEDIGLLLDLDSYKLDVIKKDNSNQSKDCFREMIKLWLKRIDPPPTWSSIIEAIHIRGQESFAKYLRSKFLSSTS